MDFSTILTAIIAGLIGSVLSPFTKWYLENRKENRQERIKLISDFRKLLEETDVRNQKFLNSSEYSRMRSYFSEKLVSCLESNSSALVSLGSGNRDVYSNMINDELSEIEDGWKIGLPNRKKRKKHKTNTLTISSKNGRIETRNRK